MANRLRYSIVLSLTLACCAAVHAAEGEGSVAPQPPIQSNADLEKYLASVASGVSPFDRLSAPARSRFLTSFREGRPSTSELVAELTRDEAVAVLKLFGYESFVPDHLRSKHYSIGASEMPPVTGDFEELVQASETGASEQKASRIYAQRFAPSQTEPALRSLSDGDLALHFRAAEVVTQDDLASNARHDLLIDLAELERRGVAAPGWVDQTFKALIAARDFEAARAFRTGHRDAGLMPVPVVRDNVAGDGDPTVLVLQSDGSLIHQSAGIGRGSRIVVIAGCHFSKDAARANESDPQLKGAFAKYSSWIAPAQEDLTDPELLQWNRDHPDAAITTAYRQAEWPGFDVWAIPTFYFLKDGKVEAKVVGWQGNRSAVVEGMRKIGLDLGLDTRSEH
jgi:hypothetical protein